MPRELLVSKCYNNQMKTSGLRHYSSAYDYQQSFKDKSAKMPLEVKENPAIPARESNLPSPSAPSEAIKSGEDATQVSLSKEAKELSITSPPKDLTPAIKDSSVDLAKAAAKTEAKAEAKEKVREKVIQKIAEKEEIKKIESPAIIFIKGHLFEGHDIEDLANNIPRASLFSYSDHKDILNEINRRGPTQKIILVGHGFGGDTAMEIAQELNQPKHAFKKIDLLVTLDAIGSNNDFVPQNVTKNINFIGNQKSLFGLLNDGPKIAQNNKLTFVENELRPEGHTDIDEAEDIQFRIFHLIKDMVNPTSGSKVESELPPLNLNVTSDLKNSVEILQSKMPSE